MENPKPLVTDEQMKEAASRISAFKDTQATHLLGQRYISHIYEADRAEKDKTISGLQNDLGLMTIDRDHWKRLETSAYNAIGERDQTIADLREALERLIRYYEPGENKPEAVAKIHDAKHLLSTLPKPQL